MYGSAVFFGDAKVSGALAIDWYWTPTTVPSTMPGADEHAQLRMALAIDALGEVLHDCIELAVSDRYLGHDIEARINERMEDALFPHGPKTWAVHVELGDGTLVPVRILSAD